MGEGNTEEKNLKEKATNLQNQIDTGTDNNNDWQMFLYKLSLARSEREGMLVELAEDS